ncbi:MFS transporter [Streptomyces sp. NPDC005784]|uniref:MFS transporter n=1 Tax=Streptomyces sp. NPDC005784 TaxID=3364731 RepID=UPI0036B2A8B0
MRDDETTAPAPLWRNSRFQLVWTGSAFSVLGIEVADIGYSLVILALTGSPAQAGLFGAVQAAAALIAGLPAGAFLDRHDHRGTLLVTEGTRAVVTAGVALGLTTGDLTSGALLAAAFVLGATQPFGGAARLLLVRAVVLPNQLTRALTQEEIRTGSTQLAGPPLGGFLYGLSSTLPFVFTALSFAISFGCALFLRIPHSEPEGDVQADSGAPRQKADILAGIKGIWNAPTLRAATLLVTAINTTGAPIALIAVVILRKQSVAPWLIGFAMSGMALGVLAGAVLVRPLHRRFPPGFLLLGVALAEVPLFAALALPFGPWWVTAILFCAMLGVPALRVLADVLIFRQVPDERRGRTITAVMTLFGMGVPAGTAISGLLLQYFSTLTAMLTLAATLALAALYSLGKPAIRQARWPE